MQLKDYIQGNRRGKEANLFERDAMNDPFLQGAIDGFDSVAGDHAKIIEHLEEKYINHHIVPKSNNKVFLYWVAAASVLLLIGISTYIFVGNNRRSVPMLAEVKSLEKENEIPAKSLVKDSEYIEESQEETLIAEKIIRKVDPKSPPPVLSPIKAERISNVLAGDIVDVTKKTVSISGLVDHRVVVEEKSAKQEINPSVMDQTLALRESDLSSEEIKASTVDAISSSKENVHIQSSFGEKEFQTWCKLKADKDVCAGKGASVKVSFFIEETGKPTNFDFQKYPCEEAKKVIEKLLFSSPLWTKTNRKVTITVKW